MFCKICCIQSVDEARLALAHGASALGLVSEMPSGPGVISEGAIAEIVAAVGPAVDTFLLTSQRDPERIIAQQRGTGVSTLQLCDELPTGAHALLRRDLPDVSLVQVVHVRDASSVAEATAIAPHCDALLLDSGDPNLEEKVLGGTGRVHDWSLSRAIVEEAGVPVYLAGGLNPQNVRQAVTRVGPHGVDLCTGVRSNGQLDARKLRDFFEALPRG